jgi:tRNA pseudouridine-54 N-methylase
MKLDQLRKIIREEVRSAVKEELQDVMNEAVKAASAPESTGLAPAKTIQVETNKPSPMNPVMGKSSLDEMLAMTKANMTNEEYKNVFSGTTAAVQGAPNLASAMASQMNRGQGNMPGIDISNLDFVKKAGKVFSASNEKDKAKAGLI